MKIRLFLILMLIFIFGFIVLRGVHSEVMEFASIPLPNGVAVDQKDNVYVQSLSILGGGGLYKFASSGALLARNPSLFGEIRLAFDPVNNLIWAIETKGILYVINPDTLQVEQSLDIRYLTISGAVLNILTGKSESLYMIDRKFGDIALNRIDEDRFDLFITGQTSAGGIPFVLRLRFQDSSFEAKIVVASIPWPTPIVPPPFDTQPPGIAVNSGGKILTIFPTNISGGTTPFYLTTFGADFPETNVSPPKFVSEFYGKQAVSLGMTDSVTSNGFYFVAAAQGFGCGLGPSILYASETLDSIICVADLSPLGLGMMGPDDIAVGPDNKLYVTCSNSNLVLSIDFIQPTSSLTHDAQASRPENSDGNGINSKGSESSNKDGGSGGCFIHTVIY